MNNDLASSAAPAAPATPRHRFLATVDRGLSLAAILAIAALPGLLVVRDRWLDQEGVRTLFREALWCRVPALCRSAWPSYFLLVFAAIAVLLVVFLTRRPHPDIGGEAGPAGGSVGHQPPSGRWQRRLSRALLMAAAVGYVGVIARPLLTITGHLSESPLWTGAVPSWDLAVVLGLLVAGLALAAVPLPVARAAWRRSGPRWLAQASALLAVVAALYAVYSLPSGGVVVTLLAALVVALSWRRLAGSSPVFWLTLLALVVYTLNLNAWWHALIGDEFTFYYEARDVALQRKLVDIVPLLFDGTYVYGTHPFGSTLIQALAVRLLGDTNFGWRFSNPLLCALALPLFYAFFATFSRRRLAWLTVLFLAVSQYLMGFGKIGYNNLQAYFAMALMLAAVAWTVRRRSTATAALLGLAIGFGFYVYPAALYVVPLPVLLLLGHDPPVTRAARRRWLAMVLAALAWVYPLLLQADYWRGKILGTLLVDPQLAASSNRALGHVAQNLAYAALSFLYIVDESHFVAVSYVDPITAALVILGLVCAVAWVRRARFAGYMLLTLAWLLLAVGASHDRSAPPNTRMFLLLPWFAWLAAVGWAWVLAEVAAIANRPGLTPATRRRLEAGLTAGLLAVLVGVNLYQAYPLARARLAGRYQTLQPLFLRLAQREARTRPLGQAVPTFLLLMAPDTVSPGSLAAMLQLYQVSASPSPVLTLAPADEAAAPEISRLLGEPTTVALVGLDQDKVFEGAFGSELLNNNRAACTVKSEAGAAFATLWYRPEQAGLCGGD